MCVYFATVDMNKRTYPGLRVGQMTKKWVDGKRVPRR